MCFWIPGKERLFPHLLTCLLEPTPFAFFLWGLALLHSFSACSLLSQVQPEASQALLSRLPGFGMGLVQPLLNGASYHQLSWWGPSWRIHPGWPSEKTLRMGSFRRVARLGRTNEGGKTLVGKSGVADVILCWQEPREKNSIHRAR